MRPEVQRLLEFAQGADTKRSLPELTSSLENAVRPLGATAVCGTMILEPGGLFRPRLLFGQGWREWSGVYVRCAFGEHDPAVRMLREQTRAFSWRDARRRYASSEGERVMDACREVTGCADGFVVPVRESDGAVLTAAFSGAELDVSPETQPALHLAGYYYATRGRELLHDVALDPVCALTPRQLECLKWVHAGKSDGEIAILLGLSPRTVHNHVEAAKAAMNTPKRTRAAFDAWRKGWLD